MLGLYRHLDFSQEKKFGIASAVTNFMNFYFWTPSPVVRQKLICIVSDLCSTSSCFSLRYLEWSSVPFSSAFTCSPAVSTSFACVDGTLSLTCSVVERVAFLLVTLFFKNDFLHTKKRVFHCCYLDPHEACIWHHIPIHQAAENLLSRRQIPEREYWRLRTGCSQMWEPSNPTKYRYTFKATPENMFPPTAIEVNRDLQDVFRAVALNLSVCILDLLSFSWLK